MPTPDEIRSLIEISRLRMQQDRVYLRTLVRGLAQTRSVIERAALANTVSNHLLDGLDRATVELTDPD